MFLIELLLLSALSVVSAGNDTASQQIVYFKENHIVPIGIMTSSAGAPIETKDATVSLNRNVIYNEYLMDSLTHFSRERIPERPVHAKGSGAFGYFEVTHDISHICKAELFSEIGKRTPVVVRFSLVAADIGGADTLRDPRGFAVKFYTKEGNFDIVGLNLPIFPIEDPLFFTAFVHSQRKNPVTNLYDNNMYWDFLTLHPETFFAFLLVFSDRGTPASFSQMPGFSIHTYQVYNEIGESYFVRFHFTPDNGIKNLRAEEAIRLAGEDPDYLTRELYNSIANGNFPSWEMGVQILTTEDVQNAKFNVFDTTKLLPLDDYPLHPVGKLVLNKNPQNYFAEMEQAAFCPTNLVPGVLGAPDKLFEARRFSYRDAQLYRVGVNHNKIPVNCPFRTKSLTYNRDGYPPTNSNDKDAPNYYPNSFNGPVPYSDINRPEVLKIYQSEPNIFAQASDLYYNEFTEYERARLVENIVRSLSQAAKFIQDRAVKLYYRISPNLGDRISIGLAKTNVTKY